MIMKFIPTILEESKEGFSQQLQKLSPFFSYFQIDVADGIFVDNKTVQINEVFQAIKQYNSVTMKQFTLDFDLMVKNYQQEIEKLQELKSFISIKNIFINFSLSPDLEKLTRQYNFNFGLSISPENTINELRKKYQLDFISPIQIMSVNLGRQGNPFIPETLGKVNQLRQAGYQSEIFIDGGINNKTIPLMLSQQYKPNIACVGSYLTKTSELKNHIDYLQSIS